MRPSGYYILKKAILPLKIVEIGVRQGENALMMLQELPIERLYLIDPFLPYEDGKTCWISQKTQDDYYFKMFENFKIYLDKITLITKTSEFAHRLFPNLYFDFIYIDGCHDYEFVKKDIECWWQKLKIGGVMAGHDYSGMGYPGVRKAVDEFFKDRTKELSETDWLVEK